MSFAAPWVLALLAVVPALLGAYVLRLRGAGRRGEAFAARHMLASVMPRAPRWRRHLPVVAMLAAAALLIAGAARPQRSVAVELEQASIMLLTDVSGSMQAKDVFPDRLAAAQRAATAFLSSVPARVKVGIMAFNQTPTLLQSPTTDRAATRKAIAQLSVSGGTATGDAVDAALRSLRPAGSGAAAAPAAMVVLSDGKSTRGVDPVQAAAKAAGAKVPIYTVALGTAQGTIQVQTASGATRSRPVPPDPRTLTAMARASRGQSFSVGDASRLSAVYRQLGSKLGRGTRQEQMTAWFAGGGLLLLLAAGAMSLRWFGRLV